MTLTGIVSKIQYLFGLRGNFYVVIFLLIKYPHSTDILFPWYSEVMNYQNFSFPSYKIGVCLSNSFKKIL